MRDWPIECIDRSVFSTNSGLSIPLALRELRVQSGGDNNGSDARAGQGKVSVLPWNVVHGGSALTDLAYLRTRLR